MEEAWSVLLALEADFLCLYVRVFVEEDFLEEWVEGEL